MAYQKPDFKFIADSAKNIILKPKEEWPKISAMQISNKNLILTYALPLAAIAAVISLFVIWLGTYLTFGFALKVAALQIVLPVLTIIASAILTNELAETFNSVKDLTRSFKLITYSYTPWLLANIIASISWSLTWVMLFSLYGIYLLWLGLPVLMKTPEDKRPIYTLAIVVIMFLIGLILSAIFGMDRIDL